MNSYSYRFKKGPQSHFKKIFRLMGLMIFLLGILVLLYVTYPLLSWKIYFEPLFASENITAPIPRRIVVNPSTLKSLLELTTQGLRGVNYNQAQNWFPNLSPSNGQREQKFSFYKLSIPKLKIKEAIVSTIDHDLSKHLVNYLGTSLPPEKGTAVVFGHSTLPQLFKPTDYKTIFANLYQLKTGDEIYVTLDKVTYLYRVFSFVVVEPNDPSVFTQTYDDSYLTLVTCTPPGTVWKRLLVKAKLQKI